MSDSKLTDLPKGWGGPKLQREEHHRMARKSLHYIFPELGRGTVNYTVLNSTVLNKLLPSELVNVVRAFRSLDVLNPVSFLELARHAGFNRPDGPSNATSDDPPASTPASVGRSTVIEALAGGISASAAGETTRWQPTFSPDDVTDPGYPRGQRLLNNIFSALRRAESLAAATGASKVSPSQKHVEAIENIFNQCSIADEASVRSLTNLRRVAMDHKHDVRYLGFIGSVNSAVLNVVSILMTNIQTLYVGLVYLPCMY